MKKQETRSIRARRRRNRESGYTLVEFIVVAVIIVTVAAMGLFQLLPTLKQSQANEGLDQVKTAMRMARETAISQRRSVVVQFTTSAVSTPCPPNGGVMNCVELFQTSIVPSGTTAPPTIATSTTPYLTIPLEPYVQFMTFSGETDIPAPNGFGLPTVPSGIYLGGVTGGPTTGMQFQSDGTFTDGSGNIISGTIFLGIANMPASARAVTILGNTGRIRAYHGNGGSSGTGWIQ